MKLKLVLKKTPLYRWLKKQKAACRQVRKITRTTSKLKMITGSFGIRTFGGISGKNLRNMLLDIDYPRHENERFYYHIDEKVAVCSSGMIVGNIPVDYSIILNKSLNDLANQYNQSTIDLIKNVISKITEKNTKENYTPYLESMIDSSCVHYEEALQRILLVNQLLWQTAHALVGLGRLDVILTPYLEKDLENGVINHEKAFEITKDFLLTLHKHYSYKSNTLLGDTGQIIILGGIDSNGSYFRSALTDMFIDAIRELRLPDPKIIVRCSKNMPDSLAKKSIECMCTGIGSPLLTNDDVIIPGLIKNGYKSSDAYEYGTSACWEPLIPGKSTDQNNLISFVFPESVSSFVDQAVCKDEQFTSFDEFMNKFDAFLLAELDERISSSSKVNFERDPIESLFMHDSLEKESDLSEGSVIYNYYGVLIPGFSNGINSLLNIQRLVFEQKKFSLKEFSDSRKNNFSNLDTNVLKNTGPMYGEDDNEVISLTNRIIKIIDKYCDSHANSYGHHYKFGLSSPNYIASSVTSPASFDGRKDNEPFGVHISSNKQLPYTEILNFGSRLDYSNHNIDGNVVDFVVSPSFVENNIDKFVSFMMTSISNGFFELQMNVLSSVVLKDALVHPENHEDLIVRVWGFSAYFNDLPIEYKQLLIKRTEINEGISR